MAAAKKQTKKDLEDKIAELEAKLSKLSDQLTTKPAETKPAETKPAETAKPKPTLPKGSEAKPKETPKPAERPAATTKPKGTLPKGFETPAETKPAETTSQLPTTVQDALENAYMTAATSDFHQYRAKVTGYSPAPNRYFVRRTAPVGKVPTKNWNDQKATVTGYTAVSNQYFATRARMAYHPADKTFGSFSGVAMTVDGVDAKAKQAPTSEPPKPKKGTLPKGMEQTQTTQQTEQTTYVDDGKSKSEKLADYEADYLKRLEQQKIDDAKAAAEKTAAEAAAKVAANKKGGALPKGFEAKAETEPAKPSRGTLPKGF
ncbi:trans-sialidase [Nitrosopumilus sp. Nsub]|uniref:trans-sialidase n=1 Tax=Nitrosopumilus sp. Nsub TaxID=1776294 RepID=UPI00083669AB|nr:trans-sialidase [Nitrosopumilus sp. Nsub]